MHGPEAAKKLRKEMDYRGTIVGNGLNILKCDSVLDGNNCSLMYKIVLVVVNRTI